MGKVNNMWKSNGKEDRFIEKLISKGKVDKNTVPGYLKKEYPQIFNGFSTAVIRNHLNDVKRRNGIFCE